MTEQGQVASIERQSDPEAHDLLMQFESLGADCEFGLVQRRYGCEPLGLLRWSSTHPAVLRDLLTTEFRDLKTAENAVLIRAPWGEYVIRNRRLGFDTHTWVRDTVEDEAQFFKRNCDRMAWLAGKTVENLREADRIYVYKLRNAAFDARMTDVFHALRAYGANRFLCVEVTEDPDKPGTVALEESGFARGYLSRQGAVPNRPWNIAFDEWLSICKGALDLLGACRGTR